MYVQFVTSECTERGCICLTPAHNGVSQSCTQACTCTQFHEFQRCVERYGPLGSVYKAANFILGVMQIAINSHVSQIRARLIFLCNKTIVRVALLCSSSPRNR